MYINLKHHTLWYHYFLFTSTGRYTQTLAPSSSHGEKKRKKTQHRFGKARNLYSLPYQNPSNRNKMRTVVASKNGSTKLEVKHDDPSSNPLNERMSQM